MKKVFLGLSSVSLLLISLFAQASEVYVVKTGHATFDNLLAQKLLGPLAKIQFYP